VTAPTSDPERVLVRRVLPFVPAVVAIAFGAGFLVGGAGAAWSAACGVVVVAAFFVVAGLSLAWAAHVSPIAVYAVGLGGFALRLMVFFGIVAVLDTASWFSVLAFTLAFMPATIALLVYEMRFVSGPKTQADLWYFREHV
jgi:hypothetical protein